MRTRVAFRGAFAPHEGIVLEETDDSVGLMDNGTEIKIVVMGWAEGRCRQAVPSAATVFATGKAGARRNNCTCTRFSFCRTVLQSDSRCQPNERDFRQTVFHARKSHLTS